MEFTFKAVGNVLHEVKPIDEKEISYLTFIIYVEHMHFIVEDTESKQDLYLDTDSLYDFCTDLAVEFSGSKYDDKDESLFYCIDRFIFDNVEDIIKRLGKINNPGVDE